MLSKAVESRIKKVVYLPLSELISKMSNFETREKLDLHELVLKHHKSERFYQIFVSITSILPLLGILGTIIALISASNADITVLKTNFTYALTSTFWGLIGAIICKALDGVISPDAEQNGQSISLLVSRMDMDEDK